MIYVHVPFCRSFCTYCDFYSERECPSEAWVEELCREAIGRKDEIAASAAVDTLYFGGGTPSVLPPDVLGRIADACGGRSYREWTVEVNPDDVTPAYASALLRLGVNRVSMGVQSLDDGMLRLMNRRHSAEGAGKAFHTLRNAGFGNISVDIIFGFGGMDEGMLAATVRGILEWRPEHISAYQLSVEEGSALGKMAREGRYTELSDEACAAQYALICRALRDAGYEHYEISNWALPGRRALHNSAYWSRDPYVGLGPGAHSLSFGSANGPKGSPIPLHPQGTGEDLSCNVRSWNSECLSGWTQESETLGPEEILEERIMLGLRTSEGIPASILPPSYPLASSRALVPSSIPGNLRIPEPLWFTADDIISGILSYI